LEPKDYVIKYTDEHKKSTGVLGISPDDEVSHLITIGQELLRAFTTIFDFENKLIGFYDMSESESKKV
jgi:peroxiredoxin